MENTPNYPMPKTWVTEAILVTILCFMPLGIVALIYAAKVEPYFQCGYYDLAAKAAIDAKKYVMLSLWIGVGLFVFSILFTGFYLFFILVSTGVLQ